MAQRAAQITAEQLNERLQIENPNDELGQLGTAFNATLARLEHSFDQLRRFTADASHELRTPLTAIQSVGEVSLRLSGDMNHYRDTIGSMLEETSRLTQLVDSLLTMARADAGRIQLHRVDVNLSDLADESVGLLEVLAEEKKQTIRVDGDRSIIVTADPDTLKASHREPAPQRCEVFARRQRNSSSVSKDRKPCDCGSSRQWPGNSARTSRTRF